jgi:hypothetical protein
MPRKMPSSATEFNRLLKLPQTALDALLVEAVTEDMAFMEGIEVPETHPPSPRMEVFATFSARERAKRIKKALDEKFDEQHDLLYRLVCEKLKYCSLKEGTRDGAFLCLIATTIAHAAMPPIFLAAPVMLYFYNNGHFDKLCKCPKK